MFGDEEETIGESEDNNTLRQTVIPGLVIMSHQDECQGIIAEWKEDLAKVITTLEEADDPR